MDLFPSKGLPVLPEGLVAAALPGDHIAVRNAHGYWHHGVFYGPNPDKNILGDYLVVDCCPRDNGPSVQLGTIKDFLGENPEAAAIIRYDGDQELGRKMAWTEAEKLLREGFPDWNLLANNCETFATLCWTRRYDACVETGLLLSKLPIRDTKLYSNRSTKRLSILL